MKLATWVSMRLDCLGSRESQFYLGKESCPEAVDG
jgi:hypothetical protein